MTTALSARGMLFSKNDKLSYIKIGDGPEPTNDPRLYALRDYYDYAFSNFMSVYGIKPTYHYASTLSKAIDLASEVSILESDFKIILDIGKIEDLRITDLLTSETRGADKLRWSYRMRGEEGYRKFDVGTDMEIISINKRPVLDEDAGLIVTNNLQRTLKRRQFKDLEYMSMMKKEGVPLVVAFGSGISDIDKAEYKYMSVPLLRAVLLNEYDYTK